MRSYSLNSSRVAFGTVVILVGLLGTHSFGSIYQDIGRHIRLGEIIVQTNQVPATNLFSYTAPNHPFINHHWLPEVLLYLGERAVGLQGLIVVKAIMIATAFGLALAAAWRRYLALPAIVVGLMSIGILIERMDVRPEPMSFVCLGWFLFVLYRKSDTWLVWTLPLAQLIWVNSHIYFFMGPLVYLAWAINQRNRRALLLGALIAGATLANPNGLAGALYPLRVLNDYGYSVMENKSPMFLKPFGYPQFTAYALYVGMVMTGLVLLVNIKNWRTNIMSIVLATSTAIFALMMIRNFPLFALCMIPAVLTSIDQLGWRTPMRQGVLWAAGLLGLISISVVTNQLYPQVGFPGRNFGLYASSAGAQEAINFFRTSRAQGPLFNNFDIGSFLIWKMPEEKVFIDGRPEAYPSSFIQDVYIKMQEDQATWDRYATQYGINAIFWSYYDITPWSQAFIERIEKDPEWSMVYHDHGIMIMLRKQPLELRDHQAQ